MRNFLLMTGVAAAVTSMAADAAPATSLTPAVKQDLQCFVLYTIAAGTEKDEKRLAGAIAGTWYFLGQIDAGAPGLDLEQAMRAEIAGLKGNSHVKEIGASCDAQFSKRGSELMSLGKIFDKPAN
jgi:hypothetical protein